MKDTLETNVPPRGPEALTPDVFFADMAATLAGTLEDAVGFEDAACFVAQVGDTIGREIGQMFDVTSYGHDPERIGQVLCELKKRIGGDFELVSAEDGKLVFSACSCPFKERALGKPSLCMMTTNVFGRIAADATGYAAVEIEEALALGHGRCSVTVHLEPVERDDVHEFYR